MRRVAAARHDPQVEAAIWAHYGTRPDSLSLRELRVLLQRLPPGAWPDHEDEMFWSNEAHLLAGLIDAVNNLTWHTVVAAQDPKAPKPARPKPVQRPAPPKRLSWSGLADLLGGGRHD